jgi:glycosyltransferase involved in cell wall biosynthesis
MAEGYRPDMRVLMTTPSFDPYIGGIERHVMEVAPRLARAGFAITVATTVADFRLLNKLPREELKDGYHVIRVRAWPPRGDWYIAPRLWRLIGNGHWDLIHCQGAHTWVPVVSMLAARRYHIPYVVTLHTGGTSSKARRLFRDAQWRALAPLLAHASGIIAVSEFEAKMMARVSRISRERISVIPNGVDIEQLSRPKAVGPPIIVSSGRLERYKGHQHAIDALPILRRKYPEAELVILGEGPYKEELVRRAQMNGVPHAVTIKAIPLSDRRAMTAELHRASVVVLLSEYESQGIAVLEALALGKPVLVADTSALREFGEKGMARMVPVGATPSVVAKAIGDQIEQPIEFECPPLMTWDDVSEEVGNLYRRVFSRG